MKFLCELYEAHAACGRYFVHELTSEVNPRMQCVAKSMALPGTRTTCSDWPHAMKEDQDLSTQVYERSPTRDKLECGCEVNAQARIDTHRHARVDASNTIEKREQTGTWVRQVARAMEEQLREDQQELKRREQMKKAEDAKRMRGIVHEHERNKRTSAR